MTIHQLAQKLPIGRPKGGLILLLNLQHFTYTSTCHQTNSAIIIEASCIHTQERYIIGNFYFPPTSEGEHVLMDHLIVLEELLEKHPSHHFIIGGDFNARISSLGTLENQLFPCPEFRKSQDTVANPRGENVINFMSSNELICVNGRFHGDLDGNFTFVSKQGKSVIDLIFCSPTIAAVVNNSGTLTLPISHHLPYQLTWQCSLHKFQPPPPCVIKFSWKAEKKTAYQENLQALLHHNPVSPPDSSYPTLVKHITDAACHSNLAGFQVGFSSPSHKPWFDKECRDANKCVKLDLQNAKRNHWDPNQTTSYITSKYKYQSLIRDKKRKHATQLKQTLNQATRQQDFWKALKPFRSTPFVPNTISEEKWLDFYHNLIPPPPQHKDTFYGVHHPELDTVITLAEIQKAISRLPTHKAPGPDGIPTEFLKALPHDSILTVLQCFNDILSNEQTPMEWGNSITTILHKKGDKLNPNNYRPIALLNSLLKLFTHIICNRLTTWANKCNLLPEAQGGFRAGRSCDDQVFTLASALTIGEVKGRRFLGSLLISQGHSPQSHTTSYGGNLTTWESAAKSYVFYNPSTNQQQPKLNYKTHSPSQLT